MKGWKIHTFRDLPLPHQAEARKQLGAGESDALNHLREPSVVHENHAPPDRQSRSSARPARPSFEISPTSDESKLNRTERAFLGHLRKVRNRVGIQDITLKLGDDCRYTPDFNTIELCTFVFWEVKGFWRDDARVKIKVAARLFPWAKFIAVQRVKGQWKFEEIKR